MELAFAAKDDFGRWLEQNGTSSGGIWIRFSKDKSVPSVSAEDALDLSLCHGWIDGQMKSQGAASYIKYFAPRRPHSVWSAKNKASVERLRSLGLMKPAGEVAVNAAKATGQWDKPAQDLDFDRLIQDLADLLIDPAARLAFDQTAPSHKKRFAGFYFDAKTDATRAKRLEKITQTLLSGDKGMLY